MTALSVVTADDQTHAARLLKMRLHSPSIVLEHKRLYSGVLKQLQS
jgi:hypothetical protein